MSDDRIRTSEARPGARVAMLGTGRMGAPMALNLQSAGFKVAAYDVVASAAQALEPHGVTAVTSVSGAMARSDFVLMSLPSDEALEQLAYAPDGLLANLRAGQVVVDLSTSRLETSRRIAAQAAGRGAAMLDAPVSGGEQGARNGTLSVMVGGDRDVFERVRPLLAALGRTITYVGPNGMGLVAKLVNQMLMEATFCVVAEAFNMAAAAGADLDAVYTAVQGGQGRSLVLDMMYEQLRSGTFGHGRELTLHYKDGGYARDAARELGVPTPITDASHALFDAAMTAGLGSGSAAGIYGLFQHGRPPDADR